MKIVLVNGSPHQFGCTARALSEVSRTLAEWPDIIVSKVWLGQQVLQCCDCRECKKQKCGCVLADNPVTGESVLGKLMFHAHDADAMVFGSPVYYGGISGQLQAVLTRLFYSTPKALEGKLIAGVFSSRRAGSTSAMSQFNLFFLMHSCNIVGSQYWNEVHGDHCGEVELDEEGLQTMRTLARNIVAAIDKDRDRRGIEKIVHTNFISREYLALLDGQNNQQQTKNQGEQNGRQQQER